MFFINHWITVSAEEKRKLGTQFKLIIDLLLCRCLEIRSRFFSFVQIYTLYYHQSSGDLKKYNFKKSVVFKGDNSSQKCKVGFSKCWNVDLVIYKTQSVMMKWRVNFHRDIILLTSILVCSESSNSQIGL